MMARTSSWDMEIEQRKKEDIEYKENQEFFEL